MDQKQARPYVKLAGALVGIGMAMFFFERYGLSQMQGTHLAGWLLSAMVIVPVVLILSGCAVFVVGRARRLCAVTGIAALVAPARSANLTR